MLKKIKMKRDEGGFTLIELLIVVAIIAILAAIAIPQFSGYRSRSVRASMIADARNIATVLESYFVDSGQYPNGATPDGDIAAAGGTGAVGTGGAAQTTRASKGSTVVVTPTTTTYSIVVTNSNGDGGGFTSPLTLLNTGACTWNAGGAC